VLGLARSALARSRDDAATSTGGDARRRGGAQSAAAEPSRRGEHAIGDLAGRPAAAGEEGPGPQPSVRYPGAGESMETSCIKSVVAERVGERHERAGDDGELAGGMDSTRARLPVVQAIG